MRQFLKESRLKNQASSNPRRPTTKSSITILNPDLVKVPDSFKTHKSRQQTTKSAVSNRIGIMFEGERDVVYHERPIGRGVAEQASDVRLQNRRSDDKSMGGNSHESESNKPNVRSG